MKSRKEIETKINTQSLNGERKQRIRTTLLLLEKTLNNVIHIKSALIIVINYS